ncbi:MAG: mannose-1-phosphate guanylyltransferase/mannose-6-phosphate isomerase [Methylibium sp.]|uniref:mannose-1-phosphate guanylyltransferase/mannose-6-phosphate isomerase n=1 Tax=Methylibium sp. TaxID=2067992 RepID=UPI0017FE374B|nr:mannose-1-phosphate guanylyltransferase/mannose-6-phosphate isomerase [Methylibium sp.]MBA3596106.1 mannose-1-phosphate guanylyltransferase/mannose-6-phosphate isomerase [Methylibium sp.]
MHHIVPVILAGGSGTRLWPLSRALYPKQFLALAGTQTLFQQAVLRLTGLQGDAVSAAPPLVVGNEEHRFMLLEQLREIKVGAGALLLEPMGRNTAPALTLAAIAAQAAEPGNSGAADPIMVVTPADQTVTDAAAFSAALLAAIEVAAEGGIVTLGIVPDRPETGFGYIHSEGRGPVRQVKAFVEKPDLATAQRYLADGGYAWNSGMFVLRASVWLAALSHFRPDIATATRAAWVGRSTDASFVRPDAKAFAAIPSESIDYAVMEPSPAQPDAGFTVKMLPLAAGWSDLGAWDAVWQVSERDADGNAGHGDTMFENSRNTLVHATSRLVSAVGLDNVIVVETPDAVLVADRERSQEVKQIVARLQKSERSEASLPRRVYRPWGWYDSVDAGPRFQVKRICVKPGGRLSLQMHHHRAEHWIVVSGTAEVTCGDKTLLLSENQSTYIPLGQTHRLANPGKLPLELIEVQSGSYLGEDDIVRFEDTYGRVAADKPAGPP